jgi:Holliday junction DNA helicase RuvB
VVEPFLIQLGLVARTARGRCLNDGGWQHLEMEPPRPTGESRANRIDDSDSGTGQSGLFDEKG